ncbi:IMP dehydrogenase [candidate division WWE3 bacterium]|nr:IMP dehydrogenase [candidate division WWE3 bacterium]
MPKNIQDVRLGLSYSDVLLIPKFSEIDSRSQVNLETKISPTVRLKIPLISINMDTVTGVEMAIAIGKLGGLGFLPRFDSPEIQAEKVSKVKKGGVIAAAAVGCKDGYLERAEKLAAAGIDILTLDVAHGHMSKSIRATQNLKNRFPNVVLISGVVATYDGAKALFKAGADSVRVGLGAGTICTTRIVTGVGVPQITALIEAAKAAREEKKTILADGGTENSGDIVKGLASGASAVISGSQFAGTDEAPGEIVEINGKKYKKYNGSTSHEEKTSQTRKFSQDKDDSYLKYIEGIGAYVPYKGSIGEVVDKTMAGIRSGFSYCGAKNIEELWEKAEFIQMTPAGIRESGVHNVYTIPLQPENL